MVDVVPGLDLKGTLRNVRLVEVVVPDLEVEENEDEVIDLRVVREGSLKLSHSR